MTSTTNSSSVNATLWSTPPPTITDLTCDDVAVLRILSLTFTFAATIFLCYVIAALSFYMHRKELTCGCTGATSSSMKRATSAINIIILCGAVSVLAYVVIEIPLVSPPENPFCSIYHRIKIVVFAASVFCVYFALWFRIFTVFYRNKVMKKNISKALQYVNLSALPFLFLMVGSNLVSFLSAPAYTSAGCGCKAVQSKENNLIKWAILVICTTVFQVILLFSFIYPLHMHRKKMLSRGFDHKAIIPVVKRAAVVAVVCVISDLINFAFAILYKGSTVYLNHIAFSLNLLVNLVGTILSFANWKEKLLPFRIVKDTSQLTKQTISYTQTSGSTVGPNNFKVIINGNESDFTAM